MICFLIRFVQVKTLLLQNDAEKLLLKTVKPDEFHFRETRDLNSAKLFLYELTNFYEKDVKFPVISINTYMNYFRLFREYRMPTELNHTLKVLCNFISPSKH